MAEEEEESDALKSLKKQAGDVKKGLNELEKLYITPEKTKGITYDADTVNFKLGTAAFYVGSGDGAPSPTATSYISMAETSLVEATGKVNAFMANELAELRENVDNAGISLLKVADEITMPE